MATFTSKDTHAGITGTSMINHRIRKKLSISCNEYVILDFIMKIFIDSKKKFNPNKDIEVLWKELGCYPNQILSMMESLIQKEFLSKDKDGYITTNKWDQHFLADYKAEFQELWKKYGKIGNKAAAERLYIFHRKSGLTYEYFDERLDIYLEFVQIKGCYILHMTTWLSKQDRNFENEYYDEVVNEFKDKNNVSPIANSQAEFTI